MRQPTPETIKLMGGTLCLDFANSVDWADAGGPVASTDALTEPDALTRWARRMGLGGDAPAAGGEPSATELASACDLRAALHALFSAIAEGEEPPPAALARLARDHAEAAAAGRLAPVGHAWRLTWPDDDPRGVRFAVATDAVALLADAERLGRLRRCPGRDCHWLFLDTSGRRRWCAMETCGSRAKMRAMYARRRAA
jgi:predicted RNA-binding Zn ribbon-like protein